MPDDNGGVKILHLKELLLLLLLLSQLQSLHNAHPLLCYWLLACPATPIPRSWHNTSIQPKGQQSCHILSSSVNGVISQRALCHD